MMRDTVQTLSLINIQILKLYIIYGIIVVLAFLLIKIRKMCNF